MFDDYQDEELQAFAMSGIILDFKNMRQVKLSECNWVIVGYYGFEKMSDEDLEEMYGPERKFPHQFTPEGYRNYPKYAAYHTYFDSPISLMVAKMIDLHRWGISPTSPDKIWNDTYKVIVMNYVNYTEDKVHSIREYGFFYPTIAKNPGHYIEKRDDFAQMV